ncbi:TPA: hypothetical protein ACH3X2_009723 [Trebouxia sp. C0005]
MYVHSQPWPQFVQVPGVDTIVQRNTIYQYSDRKISHVLVKRLIHQKLLLKICWFVAFIYNLDESGSVDEHDAAQEEQLREEQIQNIATQFGQQVENARELFQLKRQMSVDDYRDSVNAAGCLKLLQNALAYGTFNKT